MTQKKISKAQIKRNRKAWLEALRSGNYKQTKGKLRSRNKAFCCLGVACELAGMPNVYKDGEYTYADPEALEAFKKDDGWNSIDLPEDYYHRYSASGLPKAGQEWLGVKSDGPRLAKPVEVKPGVTEDSLIELNDTYGWSFAQIADAIEKNGLKED